jgi:hypothetical protein
MPFKIRKVRNRDEYKVFNADTKEVKSVFDNKDDAKKYLIKLNEVTKDEKKEPLVKSK